MKIHRKVSLSSVHSLHNTPSCQMNIFAFVFSLYASCLLYSLLLGPSFIILSSVSLSGTVSLPFHAFHHAILQYVQLYSVIVVQKSGGISLISFNYSKQYVPNSQASFSDCSFASGSTSKSLERLSASVFLIPWIHSRFKLNCSNSTGQLFTLAFRVCFCRNFYRGKWSHLIITSASVM